MKLENWPTVEVVLGRDSIIGAGTKLGLVREAMVRSIDDERLGPVIVGDDLVCGAGVVIHDQTSIGDSCFLDDGCRVGFGCHIGDRVRLEYAAFICDRVNIGSDSIISGFVCDGVQIGSNVISMGRYVHKLARPREPWGVIEPAAYVENNSVIGMGAMIVGGIRIGSGSYVAAGAIVTKDLPDHHIAIGCNRFEPLESWQGADLQLP